MSQKLLAKKEILWIAILFEIVGLVIGTYDAASYGIKTKSYQHDPASTSTTYAQFDEQQQPQRTITYHRTTTIERLSPTEQGTSAYSGGAVGGGEGGTSYHVDYTSNHQQNLHNEYQQPDNGHYQRQGAANSQFSGQHYQQQHEQDYRNQQHNEMPLYQRPAATTHLTNAAAITAADEYFTGCPHGHTGPLPYAYDCRRFINCWHGRAHIQSCGAGTVFNPETLECDHPHKVVCGTLSALASQANHNNQQQEVHSNSNHNARYRAGRLMATDTENIDVLCPHGMSGLQPHPNDCTKFINCANGNIHVQQCGPGTAYSPTMMVCDFKDKVDCGTRDYHNGEGLIDMRSESGSASAKKTSDDHSLKVACPPGGAGLYPHPYDCKKFLNCANGMTFIQDCGPGTGFDSVNKVCDYIHKIKGCGISVDATVTTTSTVEHHHQHGHDHNIDHGHGFADRESNERNSSLVTDIICPNGITGLFAHPFDYTKFLNCRNGNLNIQSCVSGRVFSISRGFCDLKELVIFTDHVSYIVSEVSYEYSKMLMSCPPETEGLHLYPYDCTKYVKCTIGGRLFIHDCEPNNVFSISRRICLPKQSVQINDRVKYFYELNSNTKMHINEQELSASMTSTSGFDSAHMVGCPPGTTGLYPYPFDSIKYIRCRSGQLSVETCTSGTAFSLSRKLCLLKDQLKPNDMVLYRREFADEWSIEVSYGYGYNSNFAYLICPPKIDEGLFLHPFDCLKYIKCHHGNTSIVSCPNGKVFSISKEFCVDRDQVEAYDRVEYYTDIQHEFSNDIKTDLNQQAFTVCPPTAIGLYPYPNDPRKYIKCTADLQTIVESCSPGTFFSVSKQYCDLEDRVTEADRMAYLKSYTLETKNHLNENAERQVKCPAGAVGLRPHPHDCTKFLNCGNDGSTSIQSCGPGTAWSKEMEVCDMKDKVNCNGRENSVNRPSAALSGAHIIHTGSFGCPTDINDGYYPHPFDAAKYFSCQSSQSLVRNCNAGSVFSISRRRCEPAENVSVQDQIIQMSEFIAESSVVFNQYADGLIACPAKGFGFYVYPFDCESYVHCQMGQTTVEACSNGFVFSMSRQMCLPLAVVKRSDRLSFFEEQQNQAPISQQYVEPLSCPPGASGMYPHPGDCSKFLNCAHGEMNVQSCGPGTAWSKDMEVCDFQDKVDCGDRHGYAKNQIHLNEHDSGRQQKIGCPNDIAEGFYLHPFDYDQYFICQRGQSRLGKCIDGYVFSIMRRICDLASSVSATDRVNRVDITQSYDYGGYIQCPRGLVGDFVYPFDCTKYIKCNNGFTLIESCPAEFAFSLSNRNCMPKSNVQNFDRVTYITETHNNWYQREINPTEMLIRCPMVVTGYFQHPFDWTKYLDCTNGKTQIKSCPVGTIFSISLGVCQPENNVALNDRCSHGRNTLVAAHAAEQSQNLISSNQRSENGLVKCPSGANGLYPHPSDCAKFLNCANGATYVQACGPGTVFNAASNVCDFPYRVDCRARSGQLRESKAYTSISKEVTVECPKDAGDGMYPHPYDCARFLNCANGVAHIQACGPGTAWNSAMEICDFINNVDCSAKSRVYNRDGKSYGGGIGGSGTTSTTTSYTDRWSNMNMARPDPKLYGQTTGWTGSYDNYRQNQSGHRTTSTTNSGSNWSGVGSSIDQKTPTDSTIYMEGSLVPNRNYVQTLNMYNAPLAPLAPLAPFSSNNVGITTRKTTTDSTQTIYYAQPVDSVESNFDYVRGGKHPASPTPTTTAFASTNRQNHSREINHARPSHDWTPIVRHENTDDEVHNAQRPGAQLLPPYLAPAFSQPPSTQLTPPFHSDDSEQRISQFDQAHVDVSEQDHIQSGSVIKPVISSAPPDASNLYGGMQPPPVSSTIPSAPNQSNLYGELKPPLSPTAVESTVDSTFKISKTLQAPPVPTPPSRQSNVRLYPIYPPGAPNATAIQSHGDPHYSSSYAAVAHSRNTSWLSPRIDVDSADAVLTHNKNHNTDRTITPLLATDHSTIAHRVPSMPPSFNRQYYQRSNSTNRQSSMDKDPIDPNLPISDALHMLLRPYFNRSGQANEEIAHKTETHIMRLVVDSQHSNHTTTTTVRPQTQTRFNQPATDLLPPSFPPLSSTTTNDDTQQQQQSDDDVELILAGEQHSLVTIASKNGNREIRTHFQTNQQNNNQTENHDNWHKEHRGHSREFHLRHPNLPNPYSIDAKRTDWSDDKPDHQSHYHQGHHLHHGHTHHSRDFHLRHPELPNPYSTAASTTATLEGDRSLQATDSIYIPKPYAEATTPMFNLLSRSGVADSNKDCQFNCGNGRCAQRSEVCNGVDDCGNRKDESQCDHLGYQARLTGGESPHMGRIEVKVLGKWGYVCDDKFGLLDADVLCRELGFKMGASEVRGNSFYPPVEVNFAFAMDEVECHGNETSLRECNFKGWGVHNCGPDEVAGVVCKVPLFKCPNNFWLCSTSKECIPPDFVCDHTPDCADQSDESVQVCNSPIDYRLEGGRNKNEGRLEVKYRGEWGTVCDDDFGVREAQVACNSLGFYGKPTVERNIYGPGSGPIWLDQVACLGNETSIDKCNHWNWGEQNCNHTEDVGIRCTAGPPPRHLLNHNRQVLGDDVQQQQTELDDVMELYQSTLERSSKFLREQPNCGHFKPNLLDEYAHPEERVVNGTKAKRGRYPWQATIRTRGRGGISSHWCGAVLIGDGNARQSSYLLTAAHCLAGYQKGAYFVRMGDHYANIAESSEVDAYIENWYVHEKFRDQTHMNNDIALLVLKNPVRFNDYVQPICLPEKDKVLQAGRECTISGWGSIKSGVSTPSNILRAAQVPILPDETCKQSHVYGAAMTEGMFCAGSMDESVDACDGDSGGPLVCNDDGADTLYGIISWGQHCGYANKPGVYVRIEKYIDWIYEKINFSLQQNGKFT